MVENIYVISRIWRLTTCVVGEDFWNDESAIPL